MFNPSMHEHEEASNGFQQLSFNIPILLHLVVSYVPMCQVVMTKDPNIFISNAYVNPVSGSVAQW